MADPAPITILLSLGLPVEHQNLIHIVIPIYVLVTFGVLFILLKFDRVVFAERVLNPIVLLLQSLGLPVACQKVYCHHQLTSPYTCGTTVLW